MAGGQEHHTAQQVDHSWQVFNHMRERINNDPARKELLFSEKFYRRVFSASGPPGGTYQTIMA